MLEGDCLFLSDCQCVPHGEHLSGGLTHRPVVFSLLLPGHVFTWNTIMST